MSDLWVLLYFSLSLAAFHGVKGCLDCDPKFTEDVKNLLRSLIPTEVPGQILLLERHFKEIISLSSKVSHREKMLRLLAVQKVVNLREWLKDELSRLGNETWKGVFIFQGKLLEIRQSLETQLKEMLRKFSNVACSEDCIVTEGPVLDCWTCLRTTTQCFRGEYCGEENPKKAENREIILLLIVLAEAVVLISAVLLKMKVIRLTLRKYLEKKLEELLVMSDKEDEKKKLRS